MTDQTPDPWQYLAEFIEGNALRPPGGQQTGGPRFPLVPSVAKELRGIVEAGRQALAAERAQHQQEIANRVREVEHWVTRYNELEQWRVQQSVTLARRDETIRQLQDAFARCQEVQQATAETWRVEHDQMAKQIATLTKARDEALKEYHEAINEPMYAGTREAWRGRAWDAEARCATLISGLQDILTADDTSTLAGAVAIAQATLEKVSR